MSDARDHGFDPRRPRRRIAGLSLVLFLGVAVVVLGLVQLYGIDAVRDGWDRAAPFVVAVKWGGMLVLIWQWRQVVRWLARRLHMSPAERDYLIGLRWRAAGALVILELLFGQNLLARLLN